MPAPLPTPSPGPGLSQTEAGRRLAQHGPNELQDREHQGLARTLKGIATEPMFGLLLVAAALYLLMGDLGEGLLLAGFALITVGLVLAQERRSERALDALRDLAAPQARVLRDGEIVRRPARELVPGDVVLVAEGERVPADGRLVEATGLSVDESLLTGESWSVPKQAGAVAGAARGADGADRADGADDDARCLHAATLVVAGHGRFEVTATGAGTRVGRIGASLAALEPGPTPLQAHLSRLVRVFGAAALAASALLVLWHGLQRGAWLQGVLSGLALGMAMLPEEFPMALAVFLALGAWRMARAQVLARRPAAIEALGAITVLCVDKTGTLTENRMRVASLLSPHATEAADGPGLSADGRRLLRTAALASRRGSPDPMDRAVLEVADRAADPTRDAMGEGAQPREEWPVAAGRPWMAQAWTDVDGQRQLAAKGAPEALFERCALGDDEARAWRARLHAEAAQGRRVLAVASAGEGASIDGPWTLQGLLAFEDPLRASVPAAVAEARAAGIAVVMITGDHAATALAIAGQAGLDTAPGALTGDALDALPEAAWGEAVGRVRVYARVRPEQKLRLVQALRARGETVAMTGDGVNDAPALKAAHVGIAMGVRGTDVAREAAALVLLQEDFGRIVAGVRLGRRIFDNLRKVMIYITAIHVPIAGLALLPVLMGLPPLLLPAHVVLTEMVIDPLCSLAFEGAPEAPGLMRRPPRRGDDSIVGAPMLWRGGLQGALLLSATLGLYTGLLAAGRGEDTVRTLAVLGLTLGNVGLVAVNMTAGLGMAVLWRRESRAFWGVTLGAFALIGLALAWPLGRALLHFAPPAAADAAMSAAVVLTAVLLGAALTTRR